MTEPTEEEKMENNRKLFAGHEGIDATDTRWYHSILDPEAKVIFNDKGEIFIRDKKLWEAFVSNTWVNEK
jgi:hypothetical protein